MTWRALLFTIFNRRLRKLPEQTGPLNQTRPDRTGPPHTNSASTLISDHDVASPAASTARLDRPPPQSIFQLGHFHAKSICTWPFSRQIPPCITTPAAHRPLLLHKTPKPTPNACIYVNTRKQKDYRAQRGAQRLEAFKGTAQLGHFTDKPARITPSQSSSLPAGTCRMTSSPVKIRSRHYQPGRQDSIHPPHC